ncbi:hypothetical protein [Nonomuraea sp. KM90]|uniref:hypothetical protein n=1 Tax=Nonomuraea sp. KM90 TaxID=3457428 RepID=UPI003FCCD521
MQQQERRLLYERGVGGAVDAGRLGRGLAGEQLDGRQAEAGERDRVNGHASLLRGAQLLQERGGRVVVIAAYTPAAAENPVQNPVEAAYAAVASDRPDLVLPQPQRAVVLVLDLKAERFAEQGGAAGQAMTAAAADVPEPGLGLRFLHGRGSGRTSHRGAPLHGGRGEGSRSRRLTSWRGRGHSVR